MQTTTKPSAAIEPQTSSDVLTLSEAAAYLRVTEEALMRAVGPGGVPARLIDGQWRFFKPALQNWLGADPKPSGKEALLSLAGAWKDDPDLDDIVREAYERRGRPMTETEE